MDNKVFDPVTDACVDFWNEFKFYMDHLGMYEIKDWFNLPSETQKICRIELMAHVLRPGMITPKKGHSTWYMKKYSLGHRSCGMQYNEKNKISPMVVPYNALDVRLKEVSCIAVDVFAKHVPGIRSYIMALEV